jgi:predicted metal-dependent hydrolase
MGLKGKPEIVVAAGAARNRSVNGHGETKRQIAGDVDLREIVCAASEEPQSMTWKDKDEFKTRVREWAVKLDIDVTAIYVRPMRRKWASCSTAGNLNFNDELLYLDRELGDYVIVHELLHFSVPNHGKLWKSLMRAHLGEYEMIEQRLKIPAKNRHDRTACSALAHAPTEALR